MSKQKDEAIYRKGWNDGFAKGAAAARFQLEAENAKLRELVQGLWYCTGNENKALCEGCPLGVVEGDRLALACEKLMRELGVEVDDG